MKFIKMSPPTNYDYSLTLITFQLMWNSRYYQLLLCWDRQLGNTVEGRKGTKKIRMMNREHYLKKLTEFFFDRVFVGHFLCLSACIFTFKLITSRLSWNTMMFLQFSSGFIVTFFFLSSAEIEGEWIKWELQNLWVR